MKPLMRRNMRIISVLLTVAVVYIGPGPSALAVPGASYGHYMWYQPGTSPTNGTLRAYIGWVQNTSMTAGSGNGPNWNNPCISNQGRLPDGWYNSANGHHQNSKNDTIKGRVWGLANKACANGSLRTELFVHTEETANNGQTCGPTGYDERYCWDGPSDYTSLGCVKISHPTGVSALHNWWHNSTVNGQHGQSNTGIIWVGSTLPPN